MKKITTYTTFTIFFLFILNYPIQGQTCEELRKPIQYPVEMILQFRGDTTSSAIRKRITSLNGIVKDSIIDLSTDIKLKIYLCSFTDVPTGPAEIQTNLDLINYFDCEGSKAGGVGRTDEPEICAVDFNYQYDIRFNNTSDLYSYDTIDYNPHPTCDLVYPNSVIYDNSCTSFSDSTFITILDSGLDPQNSYFDNLIQNRNNFNFIDGGQSVKDYGIKKHGSKVTKIVLGMTSNKLANIGINSYKVLNDEGEGFLWSVLKASVFAIQKGADILNLSLAGKVCSEDSCTIVMNSILEFAGTKNALIIGAAGNDSMDLDDYFYFPGSLNHPNLITVGASNYWQDVAFFSNYGRTSVDLFAPGINILTGENEFSNGTSFAAPQIAAYMVLKKASMPTLTATDLKNEAISAATFLGWTNSSVTGGILNPCNLFSNDCYSCCDSATVKEGIIAIPLEESCKYKLGIAQNFHECIETITWETSYGFRSIDLNPDIIDIPCGSHQSSVRILLKSGQVIEWNGAITCLNCCECNEELAEEIAKKTLENHFGQSDLEDCLFKINAATSDICYTTFVDWGDGTIPMEVPQDSTLGHNYINNNSYEICVSVNMPNEEECGMYCKEINVDCDACPVETFITDIINNDYSVHASEKIIAISPIESNVAVTFKAGNSIILGPDFIAKEGVEFTASIVPSLECETGIIEKRDTPKMKNPTSISPKNQPNQSLNTVTSSVELEIAPNPAKGYTQLSFYLPYSTNVSLEIQNIHGQTVFAKKKSSIFQKGKHSFTLPTQNFNSGIYLVTLLINKNKISKRLIVQN